MARRNFDMDLSEFHAKPIQDSDDEGDELLDMTLEQLEATIEIRKTTKLLEKMEINTIDTGCQCDPPATDFSHSQSSENDGNSSEEELDFREEAMRALQASGEEEQRSQAELWASSVKRGILLGNSGVSGNVTPSTSLITTGPSPVGESRLQSVHGLASEIASLRNLKELRALKETLQTQNQAMRQEAQEFASVLTKMNHELHAISERKQRLQARLNEMEAKEGGAGNKQQYVDEYELDMQVTQHAKGDVEDSDEEEDSLLDFDMGTFDEHMQGVGLEPLGEDGFVNSLSESSSEESEGDSSEGEEEGLTRVQPIHSEHVIKEGI